MRAVLAVIAIAFALLTNHAAAQTSEERPLTFVVPNLPGGSSDLIARSLAARLQILLKRAVVVENKPGASEMIAAEFVARSAPDGNTIGIFSNALAIDETLFPDRRYDARRDLTAIARVAQLPFALIVSSAVPVNSLSEFVAYAKKNPGKLRYGHVGVGAPHYLTMEWFKKVAGIDVLAVPYKSSAPLYIGLLDGEIQVTIGALGGAVQFIQNGQVKALAAMSAKRPLLAPDLPTIAEAGYPQFDLVPWMGIFAPAGTPPAIVDQLEQSILSAAGSAETREQLNAVGLEPAPAGQKEFAAILQRDITDWAKLIAEVGAK